MNQIAVVFISFGMPVLLVLKNPSLEGSNHALTLKSKERAVLYLNLRMHELNISSKIALLPWPWILCTTFRQFRCPSSRICRVLRPQDVILEILTRLFTPLRLICCVNTFVHHPQHTSFSRGNIWESAERQRDEDDEKYAAYRRFSSSGISQCAPGAFWNQRQGTRWGTCTRRLSKFAWTAPWCLMRRRPGLVPLDTGR